MIRAYGRPLLSILRVLGNPRVLGCWSREQRRGCVQGQEGWGGREQLRPRGCGAEGMWAAAVTCPPYWLSYVSRL